MKDDKIMATEKKRVLLQSTNVKVMSERWDWQEPTACKEEFNINKKNFLYRSLV